MSEAKSRQYSPGNMALVRSHTDTNNDEQHTGSTQPSTQPLFSRRMAGGSASDTCDSSQNMQKAGGNKARRSHRPKSTTGVISNMERESEDKHPIIDGKLADKEARQSQTPSGRRASTGTVDVHPRVSRGNGTVGVHVTVCPGAGNVTSGSVKSITNVNSPNSSLALSMPKCSAVAMEGSNNNTSKSSVSSENTQVQSKNVDHELEWGPKLQVEGKYMCVSTEAEKTPGTVTSKWPCEDEISSENKYLPPEGFVKSNKYQNKQMEKEKTNNPAVKSKERSISKSEKGEAPANVSCHKQDSSCFENKTETSQRNIKVGTSVSPRTAGPKTGGIKNVRKGGRKCVSRRSMMEMYTVYEETLTPQQEDVIAREFCRGQQLFTKKTATVRYIS